MKPDPEEKKLKISTEQNQFQYPTMRKKLFPLLLLILLAALLAGGWWYFYGRGGGGFMPSGGTTPGPGEIDEGAKNDGRRKTDLHMIRVALELYYVDHDTYPANLSMLESEYLKEIPKDPVSGNDYLYNRLGPKNYTLSATLSDGSPYTLTPP